MLGNSSGWLQIPCLCKPPTLFWIRIFIVSCGMETVSSQFMKAWPQTDVFNADSLPRSQTAPQHGASSPQDSQNSSVGAAEHPWVQEQLKPISKKKNNKGKEVWRGKMCKKPRYEGHFGALCVCVCLCSYAWEQERDTEGDKELTQTYYGQCGFAGGVQNTRREGK